MPDVIIPLVGQFTTRHQTALNDSTGNIDQRFRNCTFDVIGNEVTKSASLFIEKRPGLSAEATISVGATTQAPFIFRSTSTSTITITEVGTTCYLDNSTVAGTLTSGNVLRYASEASIGGTLYIFLVDSGGGAWFIADDSYSQTSYSGDTHSNTTIDNIASTAGMYAGQAVSGSGIPAGTRIASVDSSTAITITIAATATASGVAITKEPIAKFIDADFPATAVGKMVYMDGYLFVAEEDNNRIYQSDLNSVTSWGGSNYITVQSSAEKLFGIFRNYDRIAALCGASIEFFYNAGNAVGSVLSPSKELFKKIGCEGYYIGVNRRTVYSQSGDDVFWIGNESGQGRGIYHLNGITPVRISNSQIDRQIGNDAALMTISSFFYGNSNVVAVDSYVSGTKNTFLFQLSSKIWSQWDFAGTGFCASGGVANINSATTDPTGVYVALEGLADAKYFRFRNDIYQDNGASFSTVVQTGKLDLNTGNLKTYSRVTLMGSDIQSSGSATLEYSDDDYANWTTAGTFDLTKPSPVINRCSAHRGGRAWRVTHSANTAFRAQALKFDYEVGVH